MGDLRMLISTARKQKEIKHIRIRKEKLKVALFDMIIYTENLKQYINY